MATGARTAAAVPNGGCDRVCLQKYMGDYVAGLVNHTPAGLPVTADIKVSENGRSVKLGAGESWKAIARIESQPQFVADTQTQEIGYLGVVDDGGHPAFLGLRLKIKDGAISESESILTHDGEGGPAFEPDGFIYREAPYIRAVPQEVRGSRTELIKVANTYWDVATSAHDGSSIPYSLDCWHFENGMNTSWERDFFPNELPRLNRPEYQPQADGRIWTCSREVYLSTLNWTAARDRQYLVDEERGLMFEIVYVDVKSRASMAGPPPALPKPTPIEGPGRMPLGGSLTGLHSLSNGAPYTMIYFEVSRIVGGKIAREQDVMHQLPYGTKRP